MSGVGSSCVLGMAVPEAPPDVAGACREGVESSTQKFNIMSICKTTFLNRKTWLEITLRAENCEPAKGEGKSIILFSGKP